MTAASCARRFSQHIVLGFAQRIARGLWLSLGIVAIVSVGLFGCAGQKREQKPLPKGWAPLFSQLFADDLDMLLQADLVQLRARGWIDVGIQGWQEAGMSQGVLETIEGCLTLAKEVFVGIRVSDEGFRGDTMVVLTGLEPGQFGEIPCNAKGFKRTGKLENTDAYSVFEPVVSSTERTSAALMMQSERGEVLVVTPGRVDALLRVLRYGLDAHRMTAQVRVTPLQRQHVQLSGTKRSNYISEATGQAPAVAVLQSRMRRADVPDKWVKSTPWIARMMTGQRGFTLQAHVGDGVKVTGSLQYETEREAREAGLFLRDLREALVTEQDTRVVAIGRSAHAQLQGDELHVEFVLGGKR